MSIDLATKPVLANRYRIAERIGKGGMAEVYRGIDHVLEREVAIKVLTERSDEVCRRFLLEAQSMARLNHPNIVAVYDVGVDRDISYIILEYVRGTTLRDLDRSKVSLDAAIDLTLQLLEALRYAHAQGIIHRDIKPGNLMIGEDKSLKVMDFGLARRMSDISNLTQSHEIVGTIAYLPPERFLGKSGDRSSDLYSVGVMMYELVCTALPFPQESGDLVAAMYAHVNDRPQPPRLRNPKVPPALDRMIMRLLDKEPSRRYPDAASLIADLKAVQSSLHRAARQPRVAEERLVSDSELTEAVDPISRSGRGGHMSTVNPPADGYLKNELLSSKAFTAALGRVMQGMMFARKQQWKDAEEHYAAAVAMLAPLQHSSELARTYARLGSLYCAKIKATGVALPSEVNAAREYLTKALPVLREKRLIVDVKDAEENLRTLDSLRAAP
jgi:serine/threonine-protein kinase